MLRVSSIEPVCLCGSVVPSAGDQYKFTKDTARLSILYKTACFEPSLHTMKPTLAVLLPFLSFVFGSPTLDRRQLDTTSHCGQWDTVSADPYELLLDQWGISGATGSQCAQINSLSGNTIAWSTTWSWSGGSGVKSFTNIQLNDGVGVQLSAISSMPSTWKWSYDNLASGSVVDVAYDLWTANTPDGDNVNEIMVWLANYNAGPISSTYGSDGQPTPIASNLNIAGQTWFVTFCSDAVYWN